MNSFLDAKVMAKTLREALAERTIDLPHSAALEIVARQFGVGNWNVLAAKIAASTPEDQPFTVPQGWVASGSQDKTKYRRGIDPSMGGAVLVETRFGRASGIDIGRPGFAGLTQSVAADAYRGQKLKLTASLRTEDADAGTAWMRIDQAPGKVLRFDNMMQRPSDGALKGTVDWTLRSVVLDVPEEAASVHFGFFLEGFGKVWARGFQIEAVGMETEVTTHQPHPKPINLDFSKTE